MEKAVQTGVLLSLVICVSGCISGPVRYKTFGYRTYAACEMKSRTEPGLKPVAAAVGVVGDAAVIVIDTVATPIASIPVAFELMGPCPQPTTRENVILKTIVTPLWYPVSYPIVCFHMAYSWDHDEYENWFGQEGQVFAEETDGGPEK